ncbi:hypothetical protein [Actinomycetospora sp. CA-053990]|uniref:hypothetical protein n=1 Tax=Actinomycetospora sp. CA-053990 TaxID=3239891 RepID=UPI003D905A70
MILTLIGWMIFLLPFVLVLGGIGLVVFLVVRSSRRGQQPPIYYAPPPQQWAPPQQPSQPHRSAQGWNPPRQ